MAPGFTLSDGVKANPAVKLIFEGDQFPLVWKFTRFARERIVVRDVLGDHPQPLQTLGDSPKIGRLQPGNPPELLDITPSYLKKSLEETFGIYEI